MNEDIVQVKTRYDEALSEMPEEVQDFMWSNLYEVIMLAIQQTLALSEQALQKVKHVGYEILMGTMDMGQAGDYLLAAGIDADTVARALYLIDTEVLSRAQNILEFYTEGESSQQTSSESVTTAPTPADMIARLNQTLTKPAVLVPTKRDYSVERKEAPLPTPIPERTVDPYREIPDELKK